MGIMSEDKKLTLVVVSSYGTYPELNNGPPIVIYNLIKKWSKKVEKIYLFTGVNQIKNVPRQYDEISNLHPFLIKKDWYKIITESDYLNHISSLRTPLNYLIKLPSISIKMYKDIKKINPDIVFYNGLPLDPLAATPLLLHLSGLTQIARVPVYHPNEFGRVRELQKIINKGGN